MRFIIYLFPVLVNYILGGVFFITAYRFSQAGTAPLVVTSTIAAWALIYSALSMLLGNFVTGSNAPKLISGAGVGITVTSLGFLLLPGLYWQFLWIVLTGVAAAFYCVPFQVFMKYVEPDQSAGTVRSTALYTCSWSIGMATAPFIFGSVDWRIGFLINAALGIIIVIGVRAICQYREQQPLASSSRPTGRPADAVDYSHYPDLAWIGWLVGGVGSISVVLIRSLMPYRANLLEISKFDIGLALALLSYAQGLIALALIRSRTWMYRPLPAILAALSGVIGLLLFAFGTQSWMFYLAALFYAGYSGPFFFYLVFHSLVHPAKSGRYVAVNELVVGATGVLSPLAGGALATATTPGLPFLICGVLTLAAGLIQARTFLLKAGRQPR